MKMIENLSLKIMCKINNDMEDFIVRSVIEHFPYKEEITINAEKIADAIEKQTPVKVIKSNGIREIGFCPVCKSAIKTRTSYNSRIGKINYSWCSECGQRIDWSE